MRFGKVFVDRIFFSSFKNHVKWKPIKEQNPPLKNIKGEREKGERKPRGRGRRKGGNAYGFVPLHLSKFTIVINESVISYY